MPNIRVSGETYRELVHIKTGMESMSDTIDGLLKFRRLYLQKILEEERVRTVMEADRTPRR
jgi:predicted CopG family antitoxin